VPAVPVLAAYSLRTFPFDVQVGMKSLLALHALAPGDPLTLKSAALLAHYGRDTTKYWPQAHLAGLKVLADLGMTDPAARKIALPALLAVLREPKEAAFGNGGPYFANETTLFAVWAVAGFGNDAREALPALKKLKLHENATFRTAAAASMVRIDKGEIWPMSYTADLDVFGRDTRVYYFRKGKHVEVQITSKSRSNPNLNANSALVWFGSDDRDLRRTGPTSFDVQRSGFFRITVVDRVRYPNNLEVTISAK
jgi:hypothetical protein